MKVLLLSDSQLGAGRDLSHDRIGEQEVVLDQIAELADEENVDLVIHCGDVMDSRNPVEEARMVFKRFAARIGAERPFVVIAGDHDLRNAELASPMDLYDECVFVRRPMVLKFGDLFLACLPWAPPGHYIAKTNGKARAEASPLIAELMIDVARDLRAQCGEGATMLAGHCPVSSEILPTGLPVEQISKPVLPLPDVEDLGFDLCAFGDIHVPAMLAPGVLSVGATSFTNYGEENVDHGCWIIDTTDPLTGQEFYPLTDRRFLTVDCDLTETEGDVYRYALLGLDETDAIAAAIATHFPLTDAVVRIRYRATSEQARRVDVNALRSLCADAGVSKVFAIQPDVVREDRARAEGITESLSVPEALELSFEADPPVSPERAEALRVLAGELLEAVQA